MPMKIDVQIHHDAELHRKLDGLRTVADRIIDQLGVIKQKEIEMSQSLDDLTVQVSKNTDVEASAVVLIQGIAQQLRDAGTDPAKLQALQTSLGTSAQALADAVAANTPAADPNAPPQGRRP